jgi:processive 1,2-diacylglycerol beta-glucosyltransferase
MSAPRKILVCSAGFGEGHNTAAKNLCAALDELGAGRFEAQFTDIFGSRHPAIYEVFRKGYVTLMNRAPQAWAALYGLLDAAPSVDAPIGALLVTLRNAFAALLEQTRPAAVVSTYPFYGYLLNDIARRGGPSGFLRVMVVTDSISINSIWHRCESDFLLVPNTETAAVIRRAGVPEEKLRVLGFPVGLRFAELDKLPSRPDPAGPEGRRVLYMINAGKRAAPEVVRRLLALENIALTVTVGRDARMRKTMEGLIAAASERARNATRLIGWTREVPELLVSHHLIISKAGGATTQEAIAARCPMIISQIAPGQEEGNAQLLIENGAGCLALSPERIAATVEEAFAEDAKLCRQWTDHIGKLSRPDAARDNARFILEEAERRGGL